MLLTISVFRKNDELLIVGDKRKNSVYQSSSSHNENPDYDGIVQIFLSMISIKKILLQLEPTTHQKIMQMHQDTITDTLTLEIDHIRQLCIVHGKGKINFQQIIDIMEEAEKTHDSDSNYKILADLREVNFNPEFEELMTIKNRIARIKHRLRNKIALITEGNIKILADMISAFSIAFSIKMKSFSSETEALTWLNTGDSAISK